MKPAHLSRHHHEIVAKKPTHLSLYGGNPCATDQIYRNPVAETQISVSLLPKAVRRQPKKSADPEQPISHSMMVRNALPYMQAPAPPSNPGIAYYAGVILSAFNTVTHKTTALHRHDHLLKYIRHSTLTGFRRIEPLAY